MTQIAVLGLGAMGARMAARLIAAGHDVTVWNRSAAAVEPLIAQGAQAADTPRAAVDTAEVVISMVRDDAASQAVWCDHDTGALAGMAENALAIECSTLSLNWVRALGTQMEAADIAFLDAPVAGSRPQAEAGQLIFLVGGADQDVIRARPIFDILGGAVHHAGACGAGATVKLMVNALFGTQLAQMAELIGFADAGGCDPARTVEIVSATSVCSPAAAGAAQAMLAGAWAPAFPIELVAKDFALLKTSGDAEKLPVADSVRAVFERADAAGYGADNITGVVQLYR